MVLIILLRLNYGNETRYSIHPLTQPSTKPDLMHKVNRVDAG
ncbi:hypothetical protein [Leptolyngbya sp. FACHB-541]|nr:hypothetical protein [Leptolyngbya sp. FACHB-541]